MSTTRLIDFSSSEKLFALVQIIRDSNIAFSIDFLGHRKIWILQIFDAQERLVVSANGEDLNETIRKVYENWFAKTGPKI